MDLAGLNLSTGKWLHKQQLLLRSLYHKNHKRDSLKTKIYWTTQIEILCWLVGIFSSYFELLNENFWKKNSFPQFQVIFAEVNKVVSSVLRLRCPDNDFRFLFSGHKKITATTTCKKMVLFFLFNRIVCCLHQVFSPSSLSKKRYVLYSI